MENNDPVCCYRFPLACMYLVYQSPFLINRTILELFLGWLRSEHSIPHVRVSFSYVEASLLGYVCICADVDYIYSRRVRFLI
jgi:hypothetical protein